MGTSLSGLTPATTFDGLLKTSDNDPIGATLKTIGTGDGTDSVLQLSNSALQVNGDLNVGSVHKIYQDTTNLNIVGNSGSTSLKYFTNFGNNNTNQFGLNNFFRYQVGIGFTSPQSAATLNVKGSGATSATTSLLVQNSAGSELLKVTDDGAVDFGVLGLDFSNDGSGGTMSVASDRYIKLASSLSTYSALSAHLFKTFDGSAYSEAMRITGNTNQFVGIGETTPTARLHIKGSGATTATSALLVQNSAGTDTLEVRDDGQINFNGNIYANADYKNVGRNSSNSIRFAGGETRVAVQGTSSGHRFHIYSSSTATSLFSVYTQTQQVGIGNGNTALDGSAKLQVDSTTQGFLPPRMADSERDAITSPATGLMIYDTTNNQMNYFNGSNWVAF